MAGSFTLTRLNIIDIILAPQTTKYNQAFGPSGKLPLFKETAIVTVNRRKRGGKIPRFPRFFGIPVFPA